MHYLWTVYPRHSDAAMIASGTSRKQDLARECVETIMTSDADAAWGLVVGGPSMEVCRRTAAGTFKWGPLDPDNLPL